MEPTFTGWHKPFVIPKNIPEEDQVEYCLKIIDKYRAETIQLRKETSKVKRYKKRIEELDRDIEKLTRLIREKDTLINDLEQTGEALEELVKKYKEQRNMYRGLVFKSKKKKDTNSTKRGRKKGHKGVGRTKPQPDRYQRVYATCCPDCHNKLSRTNSLSTHTVEDIPELLKLHTIVTQYQIERQWCSNCKKEVQAVPPMVLPNSRIGINLIVAGLLLRYQANTPINKIISLYKNLFGINLSPGGFDNILKRTKKLLGSEYDKIRRQVCSSRVKYADETGWRVNGDNNWIWAFASKHSIYYKAEETRKKDIAKKELKNAHEDDILVRDDYSAYKSLPLNHQSCWAHLLRKSHDAATREGASGEAKVLHKTLTNIYKELKKAVEKTFNKRQRQKTYNEAWLKLKTIINNKYTHKDVQKIQTRIKNQRKNLLTAILHEDVPLTNNHAERQIRHIVTLRKISGGSKSSKGADTTAVNMSIIQTLKLQNKPLAPTLQNYLLKSARGP